MIQDIDEPNFIRHRISYGHQENIGLEDNVKIRAISVRGDTKGNDHDLNMNPQTQDINENPGSIALVITLGDFEFYTAGDQTDDDWKHEEAIENAVVKSGAIPDGNDIDIIKVSHHGSDTSSSKSLVENLDPEVAVISTKYTHGDRLPKKIVLKQFEGNNCYVLITGDGKDPDQQDFAESVTTAEDDNYSVLNSAVFYNQGYVTVLVAKDGSKYTVIGGSFAKTFSSIDSNNEHS